MSCDWHIYCRTCDERYEGVSNANNREEMMHALIRRAPAIAALVPLFDETDVWHIELDLGSYGGLDPHWFAKHLGHDLIPRDEHRRCADRCGEYVVCASCGTRSRCELALGHASDHAPHSEEHAELIRGLSDLLGCEPNLASIALAVSRVLSAQNELANVVGKALVLTSLDPSEELIDPPDHALIGAVQKLQRTIDLVEQDAGRVWKEFGIEGEESAYEVTSRLARELERVSPIVAAAKDWLKNDRDQDHEPGCGCLDKLADALDAAAEDRAGCVCGSKDGITHAVGCPRFAEREGSS